MSVDAGDKDAPESTEEQTDLGIVQPLRNTRLEKQNARIVTPRRWAHELRTWRA